MEVNIKLKGSYKRAYSKVQLYGYLYEHNMEVWNQELEKLKKQLIEAQQNEIPLEEIVGKDLKEFCHTYYSRQNTKSSLPEWVRILHRFVILSFIICGLELIGAVDDNTQSLMKATADLSPLLLGGTVGIVISIIAEKISKRCLFRYRWYDMKYYLSVSVLEIILMFWIIMECPNIKELQVPIIITMVILGILIIGYRYFNRNQKADKKQKKVQRQIRLQSELVSSWQKRFVNMNKRRAKKGKPLMTGEEYLIFLEKENRKIRYIDFVLVIFYLMIVLGSILFEMQSGDKMSDVVIFSVIILAVETPIFLFCYRVFRNGEVARENVIQDCKDRGITLLEYDQE
ncbi:hypothetical protein lbkm_2531 [Lachnospiraceae bacterium KM106-2]|nr:hypothetical protein lbkm_2531 [Lachnospiraceae bacterium KM106-2]